MELYKELEKSIGAEGATAVSKYLEAYISSNIPTKEEIQSIRRDILGLKRVVMAKIEALKEKIEAYYKEMGAGVSALNEKLEAYQRETNARFDAVNQRIDNLNEKLEVYYREIDTKMDALEKKLSAKIDRINLILYFLIILTILAMTIFNPNFIQIMKMLFNF